MDIRDPTDGQPAEAPPLHPIARLFKSLGAPREPGEGERWIEDDELAANRGSEQPSNERAELLGDERLGDDWQI